MLIKGNIHSVILIIFKTSCLNVLHIVNLRLYQLIQVQTYIGASVNPAKRNTEYQWWFSAEDGSCKAISSGGKIEEHDCKYSIDDDTIIRKPICQLGYCCN